MWFADCNFQNWIIRNAEAAVDENQQRSGLRFFWLYEVIRFGMKFLESWSVQRDKHFRKENQSSICIKDCWENCLNCALQFKIFIKTRVAADRKTRKQHPSFWCRSGRRENFDLCTDSDFRASRTVLGTSAPDAGASWPEHHPDWLELLWVGSTICLRRYFHKKWLCPIKPALFCWFLRWILIPNDAMLCCSDHKNKKDGRKTIWTRFLMSASRSATGRLRQQTSSFRQRRTSWPTRWSSCGRTVLRTWKRKSPIATAVGS